MLICKVTKKVVSTFKHESFEGRPLLLVQPLDMDLKKVGAEVLCVDFMGSDIDELVLIIKEGSSVNQLLGETKAPADAAIVGIVDEINYKNNIIFDKYESSRR